MSKAVYWTKPYYKHTMCLLWVTINCVSAFCEFFQFSLNFALQHDWATAYLFVPQIVTLAGHTVLSGHLV